MASLSGNCGVRSGDVPGERVTSRTRGSSRSFGGACEDIMSHGVVERHCEG